MERARVTLFILVCVLFCEHQRVFGTEVDMRVKAGDNITLYSDCIIPLGSHIVWLRNCSHEHQPSLLIETINLFWGTFPRFSFVFNGSSNSYDLHIENVSVSDEGIYYCAKRKREVTEDVHGITAKYEFEYGNKITRLSVLESVSPHAEQFNITSTPPVLDCMLSFKLLFGVCLACVLLFSLLSSIAVYCLCPRKITGSDAESQTPNRHDEGGDEVCYASLDMPSIRQKKIKEKRVQSSNFSAYSEVRSKKVQS
ncbi:uncharacterized protein LOC127518776 isoform X2 [Ctenopharyngodon idella]|uniref:uncharacterized protein LOC127518776 isoform X2 n=1 Tax=Ctenopharyngodon idella TaxID=7959 RepID=UPI0022302DA1|nr:uncharacterized protein LOC127518776 isoform X2 [Ctenopharyngodon idella]XP_051761933.1 uncharacterized protein LOC127518776 isoform X2 [Ctenopharyngodon idella]